MIAFATTNGAASITEEFQVRNSTVGNVTGGTTLLATAVITINVSSGMPVEFRALCDSGSHVNVISSGALSKLQIASSSDPITFHGIDGRQTNTLASVKLEFTSRFDQMDSFPMSALIVEEIVSSLPQQQLANDSWTHLDGIALADPEYNIPSSIDVILGASVYSDIMQTGLRRGGRGEPIAQCTRIGWIVFGKTEDVTKCPKMLRAVAGGPKIVDNSPMSLWALPDNELRRRNEKVFSAHGATGVRNMDNRFSTSHKDNVREFAGWQCQN